MMKSMLCAAGLFAMTSVAAVADGHIYGAEGGWNIIKSDELKGCLMQQPQENGMLVQFGLNGKRELGYVALFAAADLGMEKGATQITNLSIDSDQFAGESVQQVSGDYQGGYMYFNNPNFLNDIINGQKMVITTQDGGQINVDLTGTKAAGAAVMECNSTM